MSKILVIDDSKTIRMMVTNGLKKQKFTVYSASNGVEGIELAQQKKPDLIILDVMMPEMNGFETCVKLKSNPETASIPVLFLTAQNSKEEIQQGFNVGGDEYLNKPFKFHELLETVQTLLKLYEI